MPITRLHLVFAAGLLASCLCCTASAACMGLDAIVKEGAPLYPPIAKAAHVEGPVEMSAHFALDGTVQSVEVISGPQMLQHAATEYVKTWQANPYSGERTCPVTVTFRQKGKKDQFPAGRIDTQHVVVTYDPGKVLIQTDAVATK